MEKWQEQYAENTAEIQRLSNFYASSAQGFADWYSERREACERIRALRDENLKLLEEYLFPTLDELHSAGEETIRNLDAFSDALMDWKTNLDCGVYTAIHDALLSVFRVRKDRGNVIRELYKLGMGYYIISAAFSKESRRTIRPRSHFRMKCSLRRRVRISATTMK